MREVTPNGMDSEPPLPPGELAVAFARQAVAALEACSARGRVERAIELAHAATFTLEELAGPHGEDLGVGDPVADAIEHLAGAAAALSAVSGLDAVGYEALENVACALAALHPIAGSRRGEPEWVRGTMPPPAPGTATDPTPAERRKRRPRRALIETEVGLNTESCFYAGLGQDVSRGGLFVATYEHRRPGSEVELWFMLPGGHLVETTGTVRWCREASADAPPGMGVEFHHLRGSDRAAIETLCNTRAPMYHDAGDEP